MMEVSSKQLSNEVRTGDELSTVSDLDSNPRIGL
jgi:hypothetical protein